MNNASFSRHNIIGKTFVSFLAVAQLLLVLLCQIPSSISADGIFTYVLANCPYAYSFVDSVYEDFPDKNGWIDARLLKEAYVVEPYDRFNYAAVYFHQRTDVHPPFYYMLVHTVSSLFPGRYSNMFTLGINLIALFLIEILLIKLFLLLYGKAEYASIPILLLAVMNVMYFLNLWPRMYMLLFLFCLWYFYINSLLIKHEKQGRFLFAEMIICIFLGSLTHYYFYIYAFFLSLFMTGYLIFNKKKNLLWNYLYSGLIGLTLSWIIFPFAILHMLNNPHGSHSEIAPWTSQYFFEYLSFLNDRLFNGRVLFAGIVLITLSIIGLFLNQKEETHDSFQKTIQHMALFSGILYSILIYTLNGGTPHYSTALYMSFVVWFSMILIAFVKKFAKKINVVFLSLLCVIIIYSPQPLQVMTGNAATTLNRIIHHESLRDGIHKVSEKYKGYDCVYISRIFGGGFDNLLFEFGEYNEFKMISSEDFKKSGFDRTFFDGRESQEDILIYAPTECVLKSEDGYQLIVDNGDYSVYSLHEGELK